MTDDSRRAYADKVVRTVEKSFLIPTEFEHWPHCWRLLPHAFLVVQYIEHYNLDVDDPGYLLNRIAYFLQQLAHYREAEQLHDQALALRRAKFGANDWHVAVTLHNQGCLALDQGKLDEAEKALREAIRLYEETQTISAQDLAAALSSLGCVLVAKYRFAEANELLSRAAWVGRKSW